MPKVPVYEQNQIQEARIPQTGQVAKPSAETFGGGRADIAANILPDAAKIYQAEKRKADDINVDKARAQLTALETSLLYDSKTGALNKKGKDALDVSQVTYEQFDKESQTILDSLVNDDQKAMFSRAIDDTRNSVNRNLQRHISTESVRYDTDVTTNFIKNEQDAAIKNYRDPARVQKALAAQEDALRKFASRNGLSDEELQNQISKVKTETHENIINRMLANDQDLGAQSYFNKYKNEISGDRLARVEASLETGVNRAISQRKVDSYLKDGFTEAEAYEDAAKIKDARLREETEQRINRQYNIKSNLDKAEQERVDIEGLNIIDQTGSLDEFIKQRPNEWQDMDAARRNKLREYANKKAEGTDVKTDPATFYELKLMASAKDTRDEFISMDLTRYRNSLSDKDWRDLVGDQTALRNKDARVDSKLDGFMSQQRVISEGFKKAGFDKKDEDELFRYNTIIDQEIAMQANILGRKLNNDEVRKIVNDYTLEVVTKENKFWFDEKKKLFELNADQIKSIKYKDIPASDKQRAEATLRKNGQPVTEDRVRQLFIKKYLSRGM